MKKQLYLLSIATVLLCSACSSGSEQSDPEPSPPPKTAAPKTSDSNQANWIDYTPKYLWAYSSQFHEGFENITDESRITKAIHLINSAPLVTQADKQPHWGLLQFATGEMQIHFSKTTHKVYLIFGGQIKETDDQLLKTLGIEELRGR